MLIYIFVNGNSYYNTYSSYVDVKDYIEDKITLTNTAITSSTQPITDTFNFVISAGMNLYATDVTTGTIEQLDTSSIFPISGLAAELAAETDSMIAAISAEGISFDEFFGLPLFDDYTQLSNSTVTRNTSPMNSVKGVTACGPGQGAYTCTAITKRHVLQVSHQGTNKPENFPHPFHFYDKDGNKVGPIYSQAMSAVPGSNDLDVHLLSQELPDTIETIRIGDSSVYQYLSSVADSFSDYNEPGAPRIPIWNISQRGFSNPFHFNYAANIGANFIYWSYISDSSTFPNRAAATTATSPGLSSGDSGSTIALLFNNELIQIATPLTAVNGNSPAAYTDEIQTLINQMNADNGVSKSYSIETWNLVAEDSIYLRSYNNTWGLSSTLTNIPTNTLTAESSFIPTTDFSNYYTLTYQIPLLTGQTNRIVTLQRYNSFRSGSATIFAYSSSGNNLDYFTLGYDQQAYGHLKDFSSFAVDLSTNNQYR